MMERLLHRGTRWLIRYPVFVLVLFGLACGASATEVPTPVTTPSSTDTVTATAVPTRSASGQAAIGAVPTSVPTAVPVATSAAPSGVPAVSMIKLARVVSTLETNDAALAGRQDLTFLLPMFEGLIQFDQFTDSQAMLATSWDTNADFTEWSFNLRRGVQFHNGWGEVTAKDIVHTMNQDRRMDHIDARAPQWRELIDTIEMPGGPDGYEIVFRLTKPEPILITYLSTNYQAVVRSKAHWDEGGGLLTDYEPNSAGVKLMQNDPVGTGPYKFVERAEAQFIRYEAPDFEHWRKTPDLPEVQIFFVAESSTRLAMLATEEVHAAEIPRDLQSGARARGSEILTGTTPAIRLVGFFGGNYVSSQPNYDPSSPMADVRVREAMNRAINRQELNDVFLGGNGEPMMQTHSHERFPGWEPSWLDRFDDAYGFDPDRARELLTEAGYPDGFKMIQHAYPRAGLPEMLDIAELVAGYWNNIGIEIDFQQVEFATARAAWESYNTTGIAWLHTGSFTEPTRAILVYHYDARGILHGYDDRLFSEKYEALELATTDQSRSDLIREMGDHCFRIYCTMPLFWVPYEITINPDVIAEWQTPGVFGMRDFEYIKATR